MLMSGLPSRWRRHIQRRYYLGVVRGFDGERWPLLPVVRALVNPGDRVVDAGANVGYISRLLAETVGPDGHVDSFEPHPETADTLCWVMDQLGYHQVHVHAAGLSESPGEAVLHVPADVGGENRYEGTLESGAAGAHDYRVPLTTLDRVVTAGDTPCRFLKVDVEGHEWAVLMGGRDMIRRDHPAAWMEIQGDPDDASSRAAAILDWMKNEGYGCFILNKENRLEPRQPGLSAVDYAFLTPNHISVLRDQKLLVGNIA